LNLFLSKSKIIVVIGPAGSLQKDSASSKLSPI